MKIGSIDFGRGVFLAPMAGITDEPFRALCKRYGADGVCTEMISSRALCYDDSKTKLLAKISEKERPCALQIFGNDPEIMARAAVIALQFEPDVIDINMGCPAPKIAGNGDGCALMKDVRLVYDIVREVKAATADSGVLLTVKMRSGFSAAGKNAVEVAENCEKAGADAVTVHGRTRDQMYSPPVDLDIIRDVKKSVGIPVIGNGDVTDGESAKRMMEYTGCDGVMVGRGALGNPYIFSEIKCALEGKQYERPSREQIASDITGHITALVEYKGEYTGSREARKHVAWYIKGLKGAAAYRDAVNKAESLKEVLEVVNAAFFGEENG